MKKSFLLLALIATFQGCTSNVEKFYQANLVPEEVLLDLEMLEEPNEPQIIRLDRQAHTNMPDPAGMKSNGYVVLGFSSFSGPAMTDAEAKRFAKKIGATHVISSQTYRNTNSGSVPITTYTPNTTYHSGTVYSNYGTASYSGTSYGTTASTTHVPYSVNIYEVFASFWAKKKSSPKLLGVYAYPLSAEDSRKVGRNTGAMVHVVIKNSPAFFANVLPGDVIIEINDLPVDDVEGLSNACETIGQDQKKYNCRVIRKGQELTLEIERD